MKKLVISEKSSVAHALADALPEHFHLKDGYIEGQNYVISWCVGHLVDLSKPAEYTPEWAIWSYETLPVIPDEWKYQINPDTQKQYRVLKGLMDRLDIISMVNACDCGREGELIFRLVYQAAGCQKPVERLWISSMETQTIVDGFCNLKPDSLFESLYQSALCRQRADWLVGINGTRLFSVLYKGRTLRIGRVQTPTLAMLVDREERIQNFQKEAYYKLHMTSDLLQGLEAVSERYTEKALAEADQEKCQGKPFVIKQVEQQKKQECPPRLFNLNALQVEANRLLGYTAKQTLDYAQSLYERKLISYPRTDSEYLPQDMEEKLKEIIDAIEAAYDLPLPGEHRNLDRVLNTNKVTDHHALIPTCSLANANLQEIPTSEQAILLLISVRVLEATGDSMLFESIGIELTCADISFHASGKSILKSGWRLYEKELKGMLGISDENEEAASYGIGGNHIQRGEEFLPDNLQMKKHYSTPPKHYTEATLLRAMEKAGIEDLAEEVERKGLGTSATRADIIEKLIKDAMVTREGKNLIPTEMGCRLISVLPEILTSPRLTSDWENNLADIHSGTLHPDVFMDEISRMVKEMIRQNCSPKEGMENLFPNECNVLGNCPHCEADVLNGRYGAYCSNRCGMNLKWIMGASLTLSQVKKLLRKEKILLKGMKGKNGKLYDAYIMPIGVESYETLTDGKSRTGYRYMIQMEYPKKKIQSRKVKGEPSL